ncbi:hypothetical protein SDC9_168600 [bioreactor metagenome]|uniref:Uncharacterized protein n=1 Tax=bioreactor metagenome TaxID=1076179 RepID=A0A645G2Z8_9ZZZZ
MLITTKTCMIRMNGSSNGTASAGSSATASISPLPGMEGTASRTPAGVTTSARASRMPEASCSVFPTTSRPAQVQVPIRRSLPSTSMRNLQTLCWVSPPVSVRCCPSTTTTPMKADGDGMMPSREQHGMRCSISMA